jgi:hypothetical protein
VTVHIKDPNAIIDWAIDWGQDYLQEGETIQSSAWLVEPQEDDGIEVDSSHHTAGTAVAFLSGGVVGNVYRVTNRVTTSSGRTDDRSITMLVADL